MFNMALIQAITLEIPSRMTSLFGANSPSIACRGTVISVQVFGCRQHKPIHALERPASEKRQGTKSRGSGAAGGGARALWGFDVGESAGEVEPRPPTPSPWLEAWSFVLA